jgi:hypothetical protein
MRDRTPELSVGRWGLGVGRLPRLCRRRTLLLPSPSGPSLWSECGGIEKMFDVRCLVFDVKA